LGFFHKFAGREIEDKRPFERYRDESRRLLGVIEGQLEGRNFLLGDEMTIADIAIFPWVRAIRDFYEAGPLVGLDGMPRVLAWLDRNLARPAVQRGLKMPATG
jgi:GST-like protein